MISYNLRNKNKIKDNENNNINKKLKKNNSDDGTDDDDTDDEDDDYETEYTATTSTDDDNSNDENINNNLMNEITKLVKTKKFNKLLSNLFPSKSIEDKSKNINELSKNILTKNKSNKNIDNSDSNSLKKNKISKKNKDKFLDNIENYIEKNNKNNKSLDYSKLKKKKKHLKNSRSVENDKDDEDEDTDNDNENEHTDSDDITKNEDTDDDDDSEYNNDVSIPNGYMTIIYGDEEDLDEDEEDVDEILNNEDEDCNSIDERTFMDDIYEKIEHPQSKYNNSLKKESKNNNVGKNNKSKEQHNHNSNHKNKDKDKDYHKNKNKDKKNKDKDKDKDNSDSESSSKEDVVIKNIDNEYKELIDLKKHLSDKLKKTPNNKILLNAIQDCNSEIKDLVIKTRRNNTKEYYKLSNDQHKQEGELEYFKKKLSNKQQLKIMEDLKVVNAHMHNDKPYRLRLLESNIPPKYKANVLQKLNIMETMEPGDGEYHKLKMWIDTFMRIPFNIYNDLSISMNDGMDICNKFMNNAKNTLDECTYGLDDAKMQIMQLVGQWVANPNAMGQAIAIYGPKGTGKTSLAKEGISKIFGREFAFISLGGSGDSSFLEGHSYTYEGSTWGKIVQILIESKCMNPIIYFDELDKISDSPRGQEITGILTHLTDSTQNNQFHDKYFNEVDFDLSRCLFIFSYNDENNVNPILRDRMYRIQTKAYDVKEKIVIAKKYILPKIREQVNFKEGDIIIPDDVIQYIASNTKLTQNEEGVRNLKRCLEIIHTKINLFRLVHNTDDNNILGKNILLNVKFPYTVSKNDVDILIKNDEKQNQSLLSMYV